MEKKLSGVVAGLVVALACAAPAAAAPANVTVRVEGEDGTLLPRTAVTTTTTPVGKPGQPTCSGTTALGALDLATGGAWDGPWFDFGDDSSYFVNTILGESYADPAATRYWSFWVNNRSSESGVCVVELAPDNEVLLFPDCFDAPPACPRYPLRLSVPDTAAPGQSVAVSVVEFTAADPPPAAGATVTAGRQTATTGADGTARLTLTGAGPLTVTATKSGRVRDSATTCVTSGTDSACGTGTGTPAPGPARPGTPGATLDKTAPRASFTGLRMGRRFARGKGPRLLRGTVSADPSGIAQVKLSLTRVQGRKSWFFSGRSEKFRRQPRGRSVFFSIGDRQDWSYLLPRRLGTGRYTVKVAATDRAGNRAETRVVIRVR